MQDDGFGFTSPQVIVVDTTTPKVFGILNILISLVAACGAAYALTMALIMPMMSDTLDQAAQVRQKAVAEQLEELEAEEAEAETEEEIADIQARREDIELQAELEVPNPFQAMMDPTVQLYGIVNGSTGLFFNLLMFISGVGLLFRKEWARKMAIWTAALKIVRLIALQTVNMLFIIPIQMKGMQQMFDQMQQAQPGPPMPEMAKIQGAMMMALAVVMLVGGCVYPAVEWYMLSRPAVKAACDKRAEQVGSE